MMPGVVRKAVLLAIALVAVACGEGRVPRPAPMTQACIETGDGPAPVDWANLRNPVYSRPDAAVKDVAARVVDGRWQLLYSHVRDDPFRFRIGLTSSPDLVSWSPVGLWDQPEVGGVASPDITRSPGGAYIVTYNSHTRDRAGDPKLYYRTSLDFRSWSPAHRLAPDVRPRPDDYLIDAAVAHTPAGLVLGYNRNADDFEVAWAASGSVDGPWRRLGVADTGPLENYQFLLIDGTWHVLGTTIPVHRELLFRLNGPPGEPEGWRHWTLVRELAIPSQAWNRPPGEVANALFLCDARAFDGYWYAFYAGSTELDRFGGRGHAKVGIARSRDLVRWEVPPER
ncbi:MAG: hypothetical protein ACRD12_12000 [Acidimicrobiales bacterium]